MTPFNKTTLSRLGHYVYALVDPRDGVIFYVGKASGTDRPSNHLKANKSERAKALRIESIRSDGYEPEVEILRFGLSSAEVAHDVESAVIDTIGLENLTNEIRGHGVLWGRLSAAEAERLLGSPPVDIDTLKESYMLFFLNQTYSPTLSDQDLYDSTRQFWYRVGERTRTPISATGSLPVKTALAVADSVVVRVYSIEAWFPAGSTFSSRQWHGTADDQRWEFVGNQLDNHCLLGLRLERHGKSLMANELGFGYINAPR